MEKVKTKVKNYIKNNFLFGYSENEITDNLSFLELGVLDSTGIMELVTFIEREFKISVEDQEIIPENLDSISSIVNLVVRKQSLKKEYEVQGWKRIVEDIHSIKDITKRPSDGGHVKLNMYQS